MTDEIYVILIDGRPYRKDSAIRTYKTRERAEKEARSMIAVWVRYGNARKVEVGVFAAEQLTEVSADET